MPRTGSARDGSDDAWIVGHQAALAALALHDAAAAPAADRARRHRRERVLGTLRRARRHLHVASGH